MPKAATPRPLTNRSWKPLRQLTRPQRPPAKLQDWLTDNGSLTARLISCSQGQFSVKVLRQQLGIPSLNERRVLGMGRPRQALIREVILCGKGTPWVFARSILPLSSLTGSLRHLRQQGSRPLGAFLFSQPHLVRSAIAVARISRDHAYMPAELCGKGHLWGRRSVFYLHAKPLLVSEVFLPDFMTLI